jgi:hypothetical protein
MRPDENQLTPEPEPRGDASTPGAPLGALGTRSDAELVLYVAVTLAATWAFERGLLREAVGYLRRETTKRTALSPAS